MRTIYTICVLFFFTGIIGCEKVIQLDLETAQERLVIEALIRWEKETDGAQQTIKLGKTGSFYGTSTLPATGATIKVTKQNGNTFVFTELTDGVYTTTDFEPELGATYTLNIDYNEETYFASAVMTAVNGIDKVTQSTEEGFSSEAPEINVFFPDPAGQDNFYSIRYTRIRGDSTVTSVETYNDKFEDGNLLTSFYELNDTQAGDQFEVILGGISEGFSKYVDLITDQEDADVGPFAVAPVNVKGNCINQTNQENFPYGYFSLSEVVSENYIYQ